LHDFSVANAVTARTNGNPLPHEKHPRVLPLLCPPVRRAHAFRLLSSLILHLWQGARVPSAMTVVDNRVVLSHHLRTSLSLSHTSDSASLSLSLAPTDDSDTSGE